MCMCVCVCMIMVGVVCEFVGVRSVDVWVCGEWVCGCVGVVCRELIFGIFPNLRLFPNILHSWTDRNDRIHNDWV